MDESGTGENDDFRDRESDCFLELQEEWKQEIRRESFLCLNSFFMSHSEAPPELWSSDSSCCRAVTTGTSAPEPFHSDVIEWNPCESRFGFVDLSLRLDPVEPVNTPKS